METFDEWQSTASGGDIAVRYDTDDDEIRLIAGTGQVWLQRPDVVRLSGAGSRTSQTPYTLTPCPTP